MRKLVVSVLLSAAFLGIMSPVEAQQPKGKAFGTKVCAENLPCDIRYNSAGLESVFAIARNCSQNDLSIQDMPADYFNTSIGLDESNCLATNLGSNPTPGMRAKCCFSESVNNKDSCVLVCSKISVR